MNDDRLKMITKLIENEIYWLLGDPNPENVRSIVSFFAMGGYDQYSDDELNRQYKNLTA